MLFTRYNQLHQPQDLRDAYNVRVSSGLGPFGSFCIDSHLLKLVKGDLGPAELLPDTEDPEFSDPLSDCSFCLDPLVASTFTRRQLQEVRRGPQSEIGNQRLALVFHQEVHVPRALVKGGNGTLQEKQRNDNFLRAAAEGQGHRVRYLIQLGADLDYSDDYGFTALHHAA